MHKDDLRIVKSLQERIREEGVLCFAGVPIQPITPKSLVFPLTGDYTGKRSINRKMMPNVWDYIKEVANDYYLWAVGDNLYIQLANDDAQYVHFTGSHIPVKDLYTIKKNDTLVIALSKKELREKVLSRCEGAYGIFMFGIMGDILHAWVRRGTNKRKSIMNIEYSDFMDAWKKDIKEGHIQPKLTIGSKSSIFQISGDDYVPFLMLDTTKKMLVTTDGTRTIYTENTIHRTYLILRDNITFSLAYSWRGE